MDRLLTAAVCGLLGAVAFGVLGALFGGAIRVMAWLRDQIQSFGRPVWADLVATAVIVLALLFWLTGGLRSGPRPLMTCLGIFAAIGIVIAVMGLDRGGFPVVDTGCGAGCW